MSVCVCIECVCCVCVCVLSVWVCSAKTSPLLISKSFSLPISLPPDLHLLHPFSVPIKKMFLELVTPCWSCYLSPLIHLKYWIEGHTDPIADTPTPSPHPIRSVLCYLPYMAYLFPGIFIWSVVSIVAIVLDSFHLCSSQANEHTCHFCTTVRTTKGKMGGCVQWMEESHDCEEWVSDDQWERRFLIEFDGMHVEIVD